MESYENIVKRMEDAYREESGQEVEAVSDLGLRLRVLAGELYRLQAGMDWLWRQAFPQRPPGSSWTATAPSGVWSGGRPPTPRGS